MSDLRTAAQQALECLKGVARGKYDGNAAGVCAALEAALAQQAEPAQEPYTSERHFALREAYCIGAADAFWKARPGTKDDGRTIAFDAGFARGFDKGTCLAEQRLAALAQQANHLTIERLRDALVASRIIDPAAVEDPDGYDDGVTLHRIEALHRRLT